MTDNDLAFASAMELSGLIATKKVSPREVTELFLSRIETLDSRMNSYLTVTAEEALRSAKAAEEAVRPGGRCPVIDAQIDQTMNPSPWSLVGMIDQVGRIQLARPPQHISVEGHEQ